ncbi:type II secretion system F family protein [Eubacterium sp. AF17-7]|uniref:type II secretion system F family protein n=1 Tax=Eubacterium TaxID=1730 RepID=UPI000E4AEDEA|nr:type II secretion system F family protein [Eubacterium sp. AF17-7]RGG62884.1 type II secretion system F family protein [Eubacterium sp. AF17-7]
MECMVLAISALVFFVVSSIGYNKGKEADAKERKIEYISGKKKVQNEKEGEKSSKRFLSSQIQALNNMANRSAANVKKNAKYKLVEKQLRLAGLSISPENFLFYKKAIMVLIIVVSAFIAIITKTIFLILIGLLIALLIPNLYLNSKVKSHQQGIRDQLPDAMDLLGVCIESGLSFDASLLKVSERMEGPFIEELLKLYRQIQMGVPRGDALKNMANSSEIPELKTFIAALAQATQLGIPMNNIMKVQSETLRETRMQMAREKGQKAPVKMLLPMVGLIFPVLFIVILGPVVINIMSMGVF